ncbi:hypothetical protein [Pedobacter ureilyticus]|uniref:Uncharacterized protein n=1 Tax=Pedobacter ureilyticus TaxID=1393051 RepID=A0ABW9J3Y0_9SPHI|nr:hypothetical protein [Pedobacter helvus]
MQLSPKIKNKSLIWSLLLKVRVGTVVNAGGNYYFNTSGKNSAVTDTNNWFQIFSNPGSVTIELNKTAANITGNDPDYGISIANDNAPVFPTILKLYVDILGNGSYQLVDPVIYDPATKMISGLSSPADFPNQKIKIFFQ